MEIEKEEAADSRSLASQLFRGMKLIEKYYYYYCDHDSDWLIFLLYFSAACRQVMDWTQSLPVVRSDTMMIGHDDECKKCCFKRRECCSSSSSSSSSSPTFSFNRKSRKRTYNILSSSSFSLFLCCNLYRHGLESLSVWDWDCCCCSSGPGRPTKTKEQEPTRRNSQSSKWSRSFLSSYKLSPFLFSVIILITCFSAFLNFSGK